MCIYQMLKVSSLLSRLTGELGTWFMKEIIDRNKIT